MTASLEPRDAHAVDELGKRLKAAYAARDCSLRVHAAPLHYGLLPPKKGDARQRPWLYPNEWTQVVTSAAVPVEWRQLYGVALYTGLRPGELQALTWADVELKACTLTISKAHDRVSGLKAPKTLRGRRVVPLHENLLPLLERCAVQTATPSRRCSPPSSAAVIASP